MAMDWNPADEFLGPKPDACEACDGEGYIVVGTWVHEPGCGYGHDSSDEVECTRCQGTGRSGNEPFNYYRTSPDMPRALEMDGEKLRQLTGEDHGPFADDDLPF